VGIRTREAALDLGHRCPHPRLLGGQLPHFGVQIIQDRFVGQGSELDVREPLREFGPRAERTEAAAHILNISARVRIGRDWKPGKSREKLAGKGGEIATRERKANEDQLASSLRPSTPAKPLPSASSTTTEAESCASQ